MMLYTVMDLHTVLQGEVAPLEELCKDGVTFQGRRCEDGFSIERIISSDASVYLDSRYQIGNVIPA